MEKIVQRADLLDFLKPMDDLGFFDAKENPPPQLNEEDGTYQVRRWEAMSFLERAAIEARKENDDASAHLVLAIIRRLTEHNNSVDNHTTCLSLAKAFSALPPKTYSERDIQMLRVWLGTKFDLGRMIGVVLGSELLPNLLGTGVGNCSKVVATIAEATRIRWRKSRSTINKEEGVTAVDPYWLQKLFERHSKALGEKCGPEIIEVLAARLVELFERGHGDHSWFIRPAIEDHDQNQDFRHSDNALIDALRDILIFHADTDHEGATTALAKLLASQSEILTRIAIHVIDERFTRFGVLFVSNVKLLFKLPLIHEIYRLLRRNFDAMSPQNQEGMVTEIRSIDLGPEKVEESERLRARLASALPKRALVAVGTTEDLIRAAERWNREDAHPDFLSYTTSWSGPGPSAYSIDELKVLDQPTLFRTLNDYEAPQGWQGPQTPTIKALTDVVTQMVKDDPLAFVGALPKLTELKPPYQFAVLDGFRDLSSRTTEADEGKDINWAEVWRGLFEYASSAMAGSLLVHADESKPTDRLTPTSEWLAPSIVNLIRNGTHDDHRSLPSALMPSALGVVSYLLSELRSEASGNEQDSMTEAINTTYGQCIEALFDISLCMCRTAERERGSHKAEWAAVEPLFDKEMAKSTKGNFEFSTLCGAYLANLLFLSPEWLKRHVTDIFPKAEQDSRSFDCALQGYAYMPHASKEIYLILREQGILQLALKRTTKGRHAREKLLQHIGIAYLWGDEPIDAEDGLMRAIFTEFAQRDIQEIIRLFWGAQGDRLTEAQVARVLQFWRECMTRIEESKREHAMLLSDLGLLTAFLSEISSEQEGWLLRIAPRIGLNHNTMFFVEYLERLVDVSPAPAGRVTVAVAKHENQYLDFENRFESIAKKLFAASQYKLAEELCNQPGLIDIPEIAAVYKAHRHAGRHAS